MKNITAVIAFILVLQCSGAIAQAGSFTRDGLTWHTDVFQAQTASAASGKPIFAFFTGSDWCGWCHKLQRDVFAKPAFKTWAAANVTLLELDYPRQKQLAPELAQQNAELLQTFGVKGFPTIWLFNLGKDEATKKFNVSPFGSLGYPTGAEPGKEEVKFLSNAQELIKAKK
jgi:thioredoxin-related protein